MIGRLCGVIVESGDDGVTVVDVNGVGYDVMLPLGAGGRLRPGDGGKVTIHVHTEVREDAFLLFGFPTLEERHAFRALKGVGSVGPKTALAILGALSTADLANAIARQDLKPLVAVSGVGKKIAERILLELKDKLGALRLEGGAAATTGPAAPPGASAKVELLRGALATLGFRPPQVERGVEAVRDKIASEELRDLVKLALQAVGAPGGG